jgi:septal ring factor EnvC (AmiA/AmiB activator)
VETRLGLSEDEQRKIQAEIDSIKHDRAQLTEALLETIHKLENTEKEITAAEANLATMKGSEEAIQKSLNARHRLIVEVLARLQRFGRNPFPVFLASPQDVLKALSTSALLSGILPEMRSQVQALGADLNELVRLRKSMEIGQGAMMEAWHNYQSDRQRLAGMIDARQSALTAAEKAFEAENIRQNDIALKAANLRDLIKNLEEPDLGPGALSQKDQKTDDVANQAEARTEKGVLLTPFRIPSRLGPAIAFSNAKGLLPLPVSGSEVRRFGSGDGFGGSQKGILISARESAVVMSPCDGRVVFGGPYRTYGELLIINAGEGYYIILAGMDRIEVNVGQYVLSGEPVAFMGDRTSKTKSLVAVGSGQRLLYVEFRKDGAAIDPGPWWVKPELQKVRG